MRAILGGLGNQPFVLLFLVVAAGYALGRLQFKGVGLGATASSLIVALAISLLAAAGYGIEYNIPTFASTVFFNLFMFSVGMKVGPQFISGLRRDAGRFIFLGVFVPLLSLGLMLAFRALVDLPSGFVAGIFAGGNTATPGLGAAEAAFSGGAVHLPSGVTREAAVSNLSTAFAFSYCLSMVLFIIMMKLPNLLGRDTAKSARELEASIQGSGSAPLPGSAEEFLGGPLPVSVRAYALEKPDAVGRRLGDLRHQHPLISIERILRGSRVVELADDVVLMLHDTIALHGRIPSLVAAAERIGPEVSDPEAREIGSETVDVVVHRSEVAGKTLRELAGSVGHGMYLNGLFRAGQQVPVGPDTVVRKGDVLRVTGTKWRTKLLEKDIGRVVRPSVGTDIVTLALGLSVGGLIGMITIPLGSIKLTVGASVGLLLVGIALSALRTRHPALGGPYPEPARQLIEDLGLNVFIAILGLNAGAGVIKAVQAGAIWPVIGGSLIVGFIPALVGWFIGLRFLRMNDALLLGAVAGARCNSGGMRAAQEATQSTVPAISYPVTFAISNVILTLLCYVMAMLN